MRKCIARILQHLNLVERRLCALDLVPTGEIAERADLHLLGYIAARLELGAQLLNVVLTTILNDGKDELHLCTPDQSRNILSNLPNVKCSPVAALSRLRNLPQNALRVTQEIHAAPTACRREFDVIAADCRREVGKIDLEMPLSDSVRRRKDRKRIAIELCDLLCQRIVLYAPGLLHETNVQQPQFCAKTQGLLYEVF